MSLEQAVLGFLSYSEFTGYDLKKMFDDSVRHFWGADRSQIYRTLAQLKQRGLADVEVIPQDGKPSKKVYHITEEGRVESRRWLASPLPPAEVRDTSLVQIFFSGALDDNEILDLLESKAAHLRHRLAQCRRIRVVDESDRYVPSAREAFFWSLTLEHGIHATEASLAWLEQTIDRIRHGGAPSMPAATGPASS